MTSTSIACTLSDAEMRERERTVLAAFAVHVLGIEERPDGCDVTIASSDEALAAVSELIAVERRCCPFLTFALTADAGGGPVRLSLTGPSGAREFLEPWLAAWRARSIPQNSSPARL